MQVKKDDNVSVHYTGKLKDGQVFDSSIGREPLEFKVGAGQMISGFEKGVLEMKLNEKKTIEIPAGEAYGEARKELFQEVEKAQLPKEITPEVGMPLMAQMPDGTQQQLVISEVKDSTVVIDANHPLAGKDLVFEIEVVGIK